MNKLRGASCFSASLKAGAWSSVSLNWLCTLRALLPRPLRNWKLVKATAQVPASASQDNTTAQDFTSHAHRVCRLMMMIVLLLFLQKQNLANAIYLSGLGTLALSPVDQIMPPWMVLVHCRACGHIWKSRQYKGNTLLEEWLFLIALRHSPNY